MKKKKIEGMVRLKEDRYYEVRSSFELGCDPANLDLFVDLIKVRIGIHEDIWDNKQDFIFDILLSELIDGYIEERVCGDDTIDEDSHVFLESFAGKLIELGLSLQDRIREMEIGDVSAPRDSVWEARER